MPCARARKKKLFLIVIEALLRTICRGKSFIGSIRDEMTQVARRWERGLIEVNSVRRLTLRLHNVVCARGLYRRAASERIPARVNAHLRVQSRRTNDDAQRRTNVATLENSRSSIDEITVLHISKLLRRSVIEIHYVVRTRSGYFPGGESASAAVPLRSLA